MVSVPNIPDMLVIFRGEVDRQLEGHIVEALHKNAPGGQSDYRFHDATDKRPEERIYFYHPNPELLNHAKHIGDLPGYNGLKTSFSQKAMGIHMPAVGGPYLATHQLVIEAPTPKA